MSMIAAMILTALSLGHSFFGIWYLFGDPMVGNLVGLLNNLLALILVPIATHQAASALHLKLPIHILLTVVSIFFPIGLILHPILLAKLGRSTS